MMRDGEILYRKVGRKYVPVASHWDISGDCMRPNTWRLTYAYADGRRYEYEVTPDTASFVAACQLAREAMEAAILDAATSSPIGGYKKYTKRQLELIDKFRADMRQAGGFVPQQWTSKTSWEISEAAINAVRNYVKGEMK